MNNRFFFKYDICFCHNAERCPNHEKCERAMKEDELQEVKDFQIRFTMADFFKDGELLCEHFLSREEIFP